MASTSLYFRKVTLVNIVGWLGDGGGTVSMVYDHENRLIVEKRGGAIVSYTYSGDGLKRSEVDGKNRTTLIWDGSEYLGETEDEA